MRALKSAPSGASSGSHGAERSVLGRRTRTDRAYRFLAVVDELVVVDDEVLQRVASQAFLGCHRRGADLSTLAQRACHGARAKLNWFAVWMRSRSRPIRACVLSEVDICGYCA